MSNFRYYAAAAATLAHAGGTKTPVTAGGVVDLPAQMADELDHVSAGAIRLAQSGTTAQRPAQTAGVVAGAGHLYPGLPYIDITLGKVVFWIGSGATGWVDMTGASA